MKEEKEKSTHLVDKRTIKEMVAKSSYYDDEKITLEIFANRFNEELHNQNIKQEDFAEKIGVAPSTLSNYRMGKRFPESRMLFTISKELNVSLDYLFGITKEKSTDVEFKRVNEITGLTDDAIKNLKGYNDFINDPDSLDGLVNSIENKLKAINYLIAQEEGSFIFSTIASFLWHDYETNYEDVLYKDIDKNSIYEPDLEEDKKIFGDEVLLRVKNQSTLRGIKIEDINKLDFILIEERLSELKKKCKKEKN